MTSRAILRITELLRNQIWSNNVHAYCRDIDEMMLEDTDALSLADRLTHTRILASKIESLWATLSAIDR